MQIMLLGRTLAVHRHIDVTVDDWSVASNRVASFPPAVNARAATLEPVQTQIFALIESIRIFRVIRFGGRIMKRSFMDVEGRVFHWHADDLISPGYSGPERIASYFYHDCFHVRQWMDNDRAEHLDARIDREVGATQAQIVLAERLGADPPFLAFLRDFAGDRAKIRKRLETGVGLLRSLLTGEPRFEDHFPIL